MDRFARPLHREGIPVGLYGYPLFAAGGLLVLVGLLVDSSYMVLAVLQFIIVGAIVGRLSTFWRVHSTAIRLTNSTLRFGVMKVAVTDITKPLQRARQSPSAAMTGTRRRLSSGAASLLDGQELVAVFRKGRYLTFGCRRPDELAAALDEALRLAQALKEDQRRGIR